MIGQREIVSRCCLTGSLAARGSASELKLRSLADARKPPDVERFWNAAAATRGDQRQEPPRESRAQRD